MMTIRHAREDEYEEVSSILGEAYGQYGPTEGDTSEMIEKWAEYHRSIRDVRSRLHDSELVVADSEGHLLGAVTFYPPGEGSVGEGWPAGYASFRLLGVHPDGRGKGVGRALTEWCIEQARLRGAHTLGIHTTEVMAVAKAMYERMGFERFPEKDLAITAGFTVLAYRLSLA